MENQQIKLNLRKSNLPKSAVTGNPLIDSMDLDELVVRRDLSTTVDTAAAYSQRLKALAHEQAVQRTNYIMATRKKKADARSKRNHPVHTNIVTESEIAEMQSGGNLNEKQENVQDHSGESSKHITVGKTQAVNDNGLDDQYSLAKFLSRPVSIYDTTFASGTEYNISIKPWDLWSLQPSVRAKLSNYAYFKGTLKVKLSFSGTPFHYGRFMLSYQPFIEANDVITSYDSMLAATTPGSDALEPYKCYMSQAPGVTYVDVKENEPIIMELPFFAPKEQLRLFNNTTTVITNATSYQDFEAMGTLRIISLNQVQIANEDFDSAVSLNVYAWCEDVTLTIPTGTDIDVTAESDIVTEGKSRNRKHAKKTAAKIENLAEDLESDLESDDDPEESVRRKNWSKSQEGRAIYDSSKSWGDRIGQQMEGAGEYTEPGPMTQIASAVSNVGDSLKDIPYIGGFAKATSYAAGLAGKALGFFGLSKPVILDKTMFVKNMPYVNGATFAGHETTYKLSCDPKQELTIDQSLGGHDDQDCMAINHISSRESYLTSFTWSSSDTAMQTNLWQGCVSPTLFTRTAAFNGGKIIQPTAMAFAAAPFGYWRGTIKFRFEFVCSKFHRGKVLIKYEPNVSQAALIDTGDTKLNQQTSIIVDLQQTQDVCMDIEWNNSRAWCILPTMGPTEDLAVTNNQSCTPEGYDNTYMLGYVTVRPLNELVQPTDLSTVPVNVYVSCDDLMVAAPSVENIDFNKNFTVTQSQIVTEGEVDNEDVTHDTLIVTGASHDKAALMHFGEKIVSFRAALKRYAGVGYFENSVPATGDLFTLKFKGSLYPRSCSAPGRADRTDSFQKTVYNWLRFAYVGVRGGMRYRVRYIDTRESDRSHYYVTARRAGYASYATTLDGMDIAAISSSTKEDIGASWQGSTLYHLMSNGGVEFEVPYYSENVFQFSYSDDEGANYSSNDVSVDFVNLWNCNYTVDGINNDSIYGYVDAATAEDFTFLRFQGAPFVSTV